MDILKELKIQTSALHSAAEEHPLMASFVTKDFKKDHLIKFLINIRPVYETVEQRLLVPYIHRNFDLCRSRLISKDIAKIYSEEKENITVGSFKIYPCTSRWVISQWESTPDTLIADLYVRWFADLFGGRRLSESLDPYNTSLGFKDIPEAISNVREAIMEHANTLEMSTEYLNYRWTDITTKQKIILDRAKAFFQYHIDLFDCIYKNT